MPINNLNNDIDISELINKTKGFSGAEVVAVCNEATYIAIDLNDEYIKQNHLIQAINNMKPQITVKMLEFYENIAKGFKI